MKLENQVCSLELAKKLKELGCKQESLFYWCNVGQERFTEDTFWNGYRLRYEGKPRSEFEEVKDLFSAFTVAELGKIIMPKNYTNCVVGKGYRDWYIEYNGLQANADTEADARAKMLIYLLENELLTLPV